MAAWRWSAVGAACRGVAVGLLGAVSASAWGATFAVDTHRDAGDAAAGDGVCADAVGACTLRAAIEEANATAGTDEVVLGAREVWLTLGELVITDATVVVGEGWAQTSVSGRSMTRVLHVDASGEVEVRGLTLRNGAALVGEDGGCMLADSDVALVGVRLLRCAAERGGGLFGAARVSMVDGVVAHNEAASEGGGVWGAGDSLVADAVSFVGNTAEEGAALSWQPGDPAHLASVLNSGFIENLTRNGAVVHAAGSLDLVGVRLVDNDADSAVIQDVNAPLAIWDAVIARSGDHRSVGSFGDLLLYGVVADMGASAYGAGTAVDLQDVLLGTTDSVAFGAWDVETVRISGAHLHADDTGVMLIQAGNSDLEDVVITAFAQGLVVSGGTVEMARTHVQRGMTVQLGADVTLRDGAVTGHEGDGAAMWVEAGSALTLEDCRILGNQHDDCWYCGEDDGGALVNEGTTTAIRTRFVGNYASNRGGAVVNRGVFIAEDTRFAQNSSMVGGAIYNDGGTLSLTRVTMDGNVAAEGGAVALVGGSIEVVDSAFHHNAAAYGGWGGVFSGFADGLIRNSSFVRNDADADGAVFALEGPGSLLLDQVTVAFNRADADGDGSGGGAVWVGDGHEVAVHDTILADQDDGADDVACALSGSGRLVSDGWNVVSVDCGVFSAPGDQAGDALTPLDAALGEASSPDGLRVAVPLAGSPAIDAAADCTATDQLGRPRPTDGDGDGTPACDVGALEVP